MVVTVESQVSAVEAVDTEELEVMKEKEEMRTSAEELEVVIEGMKKLVQK